MFATINIQKIKTDSELEARYNHNRRLGKVSSNVQISQIHRSKPSKHNISDSSKHLFRQVQSNRMKAGANQMRSTSVKAVELVLGASSEYFEGKTNFQEATEKIKKNTRRYAKRQLTWFNKINSIPIKINKVNQTFDQIIKKLE
jgi:tRNA A37 N6-isopentenylltransferase MiaA